MPVEKLLPSLGPSQSLPRQESIHGSSKQQPSKGKKQNEII